MRNIAALVLVASIGVVGNNVSFAVGFPQAGQQSTDPNSALPPKEKSPARVFVSREVLAKMIISKKAAVYSPEAAAKNAEGPVVVSIVIDQDGKVSYAKDLAGYAVLGPAAVAAVRQWKFRPAVFQGKRVEVTSDVVVEVPSPDRSVSSALLQVDTDTAETHLLRSPKLDYPSGAATARIQGYVIVKCEIGTDGKVLKAKAISGHPWLTTAAEVAVSKQLYNPFTKDGTPVEAETYVIEMFKLP
jgi:TonB family protein